MNFKNIFFIFTFSFIYFFNVNAQIETLFYASDKGQVYFLLEFKKRKISNSDTYYTEWSWGPSLTKNNSFDNYILHLEEKSFSQSKGNKHAWIKIEELEKITHNSKSKTQHKNGLSKLKVDSLPNINCNSKISIKNYLQKGVYSRMIDILKTPNSFFENLFERLKKEAQEKEAKEESDEKEWKLINRDLGTFYQGYFTNFPHN